MIHVRRDKTWKSGDGQTEQYQSVTEWCEIKRLAHTQIENKRSYDSTLRGLNTCNVVHRKQSRFRETKGKVTGTVSLQLIPLNTKASCWLN